MMQKYRLVALVAAVLAWDAGMPAVAQQAGADSRPDLEAVIVTARRQFRPEDSSAASRLTLPVVETPQALTVLGSEFLDIASLRNTAQVVAYTAGVENGGIGDGTEASLSARGFYVDRERSYRINGLSVYSEIDLDYFAMERVEIVRGPASSLYGEADYGATFNRVLKKPQQSLAGTIGIEGGDYDFRRVQGDVTGPLGDGGFAGRTIGVYQEGGDFVDHTGLDHWLLAPSVSWSNDSTELLFHVYYSQFDGPTSDGFPLVLDGEGEWQLPDVPRERNYGATTNDIDSTNEFYFGMLTHEFGDSLKLTVGAALSKVDMFNQSSYLCDCDDVEGDGIADLYYFTEDKDQENLSVDVALEKSFDWRGREQRILISADWRRDDLFQPFPPSDIIGSMNFVDEGGPLPYETPDLDTGDFFDGSTEYSGATLLAYLRPTDRFAMLAGVRYTKIESDLFEVFGGEVTIDDSGDDDDIVPRLGMTYRVGDAQFLFASYSKGIIFNETLRDVNRNPIRPEQGVQYEIGVKGELFDKRLFYALSAFTIDRTDIAAFDPDTPPGEPDVYYNTGKQTHEGVELEFQGEPMPGFNVYFSYAYLDATIRQSPEPDAVGQAPSAAPRHSLSAFATYEVLAGPLESLSFGGGVVWRTEREIDSFGTFQLPEYTRFDLRVAYDLTEQLSVNVNARNITNEKIYTAVYESPMFGNAFSDVRTYTVGLDYRF